MSGDFETLEINQPKITYLKPEDNTEWLDKLINNVEDMKNKISKDSQKFKKRNFFIRSLVCIRSNSKKNLNFVLKAYAFLWAVFRIRVQLFFMQKDLDENSYEKRIENIEKGKSYLKSNGFFKSKSNLFEDIQKFIYKR